MPNLLGDYTQLKAKMTRRGDLVKILQVNDIEPYLNLLADFGEKLGQLGRSAAQYNDLNNKIREARTRGVPFPPELEQGRDNAANEVLKNAPEALQKFGEPLKAQRPSFQKNMLNIIEELRKVETKTPDQRTDVINMLNLLKSANRQAEMESNNDFDIITAMIEAVRNKKQIDILGRTS